MDRDKVKIKGRGWNKSFKISRDKYDAVSTVILKVLSDKPLRFSEVENEVKKQLTTFEGSVGWYTISILRELETQGKIKRIKGRTVTYLK